MDLNRLLRSTDDAPPMLENRDVTVSDDEHLAELPLQIQLFVAGPADLSRARLDEAHVSHDLDAFRQDSHLTFDHLL
ncbi:hypothetical protein D3C86_1967160 [compost metagenome]